MSSFRKWEGPPPDPPTSQIRSHIKDSIEIAGGPSWRKFLHICEVEWCTFMKLLRKLSETELIDFLLFCYQCAYALLSNIYGDFFLCLVILAFAIKHHIRNSYGPPCTKQDNLTAAVLHLWQHVYYLHKSCE